MKILPILKLIKAVNLGSKVEAKVDLGHFGDLPRGPWYTM